MDTAEGQGYLGALACAMNGLLTELLAWVADRPRTYGETMDAWRTSCPRAPVWEDATSAGLVEVVPGSGAGLRESVVRLTASGRAALVAAADGAERGG
jgi:hypothetical protein